MITLSTEKTKTLLSELIRSEFDKEHEFWSDRPFELIQLAKHYGLNDLANEMQKDLI
jgi:hypothetical protein